LSPGAICPKCGYARNSTDTAPDWQCPSCGIAIHKYQAQLAGAQALVATPAPELSHLRLPFANRLAGAAPDLALAALFLWCWIAPTAWRPTLASELGVLMLMEFFAIHSGFFLAGAGPAPGESVGAKSFVIMMIVLAFYLPVGGAFMYFHGGWWPALALAWLLLSRVTSVLVGRGPGEFEKKRQTFYWANGGAYYILSALLVLLLVPVPRLGFGSPRWHGYVWDSGWRIQPHEVMAWGFLSFGALALTKLLEKPEWIERQDEAVS
jgi:hypothetical protein